MTENPVQLMTLSASEQWIERLGVEKETDENSNTSRNSNKNKFCGIASQDQEAIQGFTSSMFIFLNDPKEWYYYYSHSKVTKLKSGKGSTSFTVPQLQHYRCRSPAEIRVPNSILNLLPQYKLHVFCACDFISKKSSCWNRVCLFLFKFQYNTTFIQHNDWRQHYIYRPIHPIHFS